MSVVESQVVLKPHEIIEEAINQGAKKFVPLFSGGKDSTVINDFMYKNYPDMIHKSVYTVTGVGLKESRKFAVDEAERKGWDLEFTWSGFNFDEFLIKYGFVGVMLHSNVMFKLKFKSWREYEKRNRDKGIWFVSGVRRKESKKRNVKTNKNTQYKTPWTHDGKTKFVKPFFYNTAFDNWDYIAKNDCRVTPVFDILSTSGDCGCGCYGETEELFIYKKHFPYFYDWIKYIEKQIQIRGSPMAKKYPVWSSGKNRMSTKDVDSQTLLDDYSQGNEFLGDDLCQESCSFVKNT